MLPQTPPIHSYSCAMQDEAHRKAKFIAGGGGVPLQFLRHIFADCQAVLPKGLPRLCVCLFYQTCLKKFGRYSSAVVLHACRLSHKSAASFQLICKGEDIRSYKAGQLPLQKSKRPSTAVTIWNQLSPSGARGPSKL